ncbi:hypothetical protein B0H13DRAFT_2333036 [Mycena leptocephala]|nr:hypothetical protein B0H13DRAFT_2333036 [Mycena leptocephala]
MSYSPHMERPSRLSFFTGLRGRSRSLQPAPGTDGRPTTLLTSGSPADNPYLLIAAPSDSPAREQRVKEVTFEGLKTVFQGLFDCSDMFLPLKTVAGVFLTICNAIEMASGNKKELEDLETKLTAIVAIVEKYKALSGMPALNHGIKIFCQAMQLQMDEVSPLARIAEGGKDADKILKVLQNISKTKSLWPSIIVRPVPVFASQIRTAWSSELDATRVPSGENATERTKSLWPSIIVRPVPVFASQIRTAWSSELDATRVPSGENATERTTSLWPSILVSSAPVIASQIRTVSSAEPDTTRAPSGENAKELTESLWPSIVVSSAPVIASQIRTVSSAEPDTTHAPSGENATETDWLWPSTLINILCREMPLHSMEGSPGKCNLQFFKVAVEVKANSVARLLT